MPIQKQIDDSLLFVANMNFFEIIFPFAAFSSNDRSPTDVFYDICSAKSSAASAFWPFRKIFGYQCFLLFASFLPLPKDSYC